MKWDEDTDLILFTETKPVDAKTIIPVTVKEDGKIALTEWLERFLHKNPEWREKYLIETEKGPVLNLEKLDGDHMVLTVIATKDGQVRERRILLKPHKQDIVRTRIEKIANPEDIIICEFEVESWQKKMLSVAEAKDIYRNQYGIEDEILGFIAEKGPLSAFSIKKMRFEEF